MDEILLYWAGFNRFVEQNPEKYRKLVKDKTVKPSGNEPTDEFYLKCVKLGQELQLN